MMVLTLLRMDAGRGLTQDQLADMAADLNRNAREGWHQSITMPAGWGPHRVGRAWVEGERLMVEAEEVTK